MTIGVTNAGRSAKNDALAALLGNGTIKIYDGARPTSANDAVTTQTLLVELTLASPAFGASVNGVATLSGVPIRDDVLLAGTATWARWVNLAGSTIFDCSVTATGGGGDIELTTVVLGLGYKVELSSFTLTVPEVCP